MQSDAVEPGDRREVSLALKLPIITSQNEAGHPKIRKRPVCPDSPHLA